MTNLAEQHLALTEYLDQKGDGAYPIYTGIPGHPDLNLGYDGLKVIIKSGGAVTTLQISEANENAALLLMMGYHLSKQDGNEELASQYESELVKIADTPNKSAPA